MVAEPAPYIVGALGVDHNHANTSENQVPSNHDCDLWNTKKNTITLKEPNA
jgi:hypothetical protein